MAEALGGIDSSAMVEAKPGAARARPSGPYVGPKPFGTEDADRFFGRERESHELAAMVQAHPIVVLYSQSGAGKTSLLNARLVPMLEARGAVVHAGVRVGQRVDGAEKASNVFTYNTLAHLCGKKPNPADTLGDFVERTPALRPDGRPARLRVIVLDQFEEMFTLLPEHWQQRKEFFQQIGRTLDTDDLRERAGRLRRIIAWCDRRIARARERGGSTDKTRALRARAAEDAAAGAKAIERADSLRYVIALREEFIAELDPLACHVPERLGARYRLERLREPQAMEAVVKPLEGTGVSYAPGSAELLVSNLRRSTGASVNGTLDVSDEFIEPVHLQVVCESLWRNFGKERGIITEDHVRSCGNIDEALLSYFEQSIAQVARKPDWDLPQLRCWFATELIREGRRVLVMQAGQSVAGLPMALANHLAGLQLLRAVPRAGVTYFEVTHDRFIRPILCSHAAWREQMRAKNPSLAEWESRALAWAQAGRGASGLLPPHALAAADTWIKSEEARTLTPSDELRQYVQTGLAARAAFEAARPDIAHAEAAAECWEREGRPPMLLFGRDQLGRIEEWTASAEAEHVGYTPALKALEAASRAALNDLEKRLPELVRLEGRARQWVKTGRNATELLTFDQLAEAERIEADQDAACIGMSAAAKELIAASREARDKIEHEHPILPVWEQRAAAWRSADRPPSGLAKGQELEELTAWLSEPVSLGLGASRTLDEWGTASQRRQDELRARHPGAMYLTKRAIDWDKKYRSFSMLLPVSQARTAKKWLDSEDAKEMGVSDLTRDFIVASVTWARTAAVFGFFSLACIVTVVWLGISAYNAKAARVKEAEHAEAEARKAVEAGRKAAEAGDQINAMIQSVSGERSKRAASLVGEKGREYEALAAAILAVGDPVLGGKAPDDAVEILRTVYDKVRGPTPLRDLGGEEPKSVHVSAQGKYALVVCPRGLYFFDCRTARRLGEPVRPLSPESRWVDGHFTPDDGLALAIEAPPAGESAGDAEPNYAANAPMLQQKAPPRRERPAAARIRIIPVPGVEENEKPDVRIFDPGVRNPADLGSNEDASVCYAIIHGQVRVWPAWPRREFFDLKDSSARGNGSVDFTDELTRVIISGKRDRVVTVCESRGIELWSFKGDRVAELTFDTPSAEKLLPTVLWMPAGNEVVGVQLSINGNGPDGHVTVWDAANGATLRRFKIQGLTAEYVSLVDDGRGMIVVGSQAGGAKQAVTVSTQTGSPVSPPVALGLADLLGVRVLMDGRAIAFGAKSSENDLPMAYAEVASTTGSPSITLVAPKHVGYCADADTDSALRYTMCIRQDENYDLGVVFLWDREHPAPDPAGMSKEDLIAAACRAIDSQPERTQVVEVIRRVLGGGTTY